MLRRHFMMNQGVDILSPLDNEIWYTSSDGNVVAPHKTSVFGANIISNTYENSKGVIVFDSPVTSIGDSAFLSCTKLISIELKGTIEQWNAISKGDNWNKNIPATVVHCTDGDVEL